MQVKIQTDIESQKQKYKDLSQMLRKLCEMNKRADKLIHEGLVTKEEKEKQVKNERGERKVNIDVLRNPLVFLCILRVF
jgi:hypothetical protein